MNYTVSKLAKLAGISVRTLHYYDEIGLLRPSLVKENKYRFYSESELIKLSQILFFKELEFPLNEIIQILKSPDFDQIEILKDQQKLLLLKEKRINKLIKTINRTVEKLKGGENMNTDDLFKSFEDDELVENMEEAKKRWGETDAYRQSMERVKKWTKKDYERVKKQGEEFTKKLAEAMDLDIKSTQVQTLIKKHHEGVEYFYSCPVEMYRGLADMYVSDPRFAKYYNKYRPGLAVWLRDAILYFCDKNFNN